MDTLTANGVVRDTRARAGHFHMGECLVCGLPVGISCPKCKTFRCKICGATAVLDDNGLCSECDYNIARVMADDICDYRIHERDYRLRIPAVLEAATNLIG